MTRGKAQPTATEAATAAEELSAKETQVKGGAPRPARKLSREALLLVNANNFLAEGGAGSGGAQRVASRARGRASAPNHDCSPPNVRRKNGQSAPPVPDRESLEALQQSPQEHNPALVSGGKGPKNKRPAAAAVDAKEDETKRRKKERSSGQQGQPPSSGSMPEARTSGEQKDLEHLAAHRLPPTAPAGELGVRPQGAKQNSAAVRPSHGRDHAAGDGGTATDTTRTGQPVATDGGSKKSRKGKGQAAFAAVEVPSACDAAPGSNQEAGQPLVSLQAANAVGLCQAPQRNATTPIETAGAEVHPTGLVLTSATNSLGAQREGTGARMRAPQRPAANAALADAGPSGSVQQANCGATAGAPRLPSVSADMEEMGRQLPVNGTTPVKAFLPIPLPRLDEIGQQERIAVADLQRQLAEVRALYDDLKATKIGDLGKVLAEQAQCTDEQVRQAQQRAQLWQAAAECAEAKLKAANLPETMDRMESLEARNEELLRESSSLMRRVAQLERELVVAQQAYHDARAALMQFQAAPGNNDGEADGASKGDDEEADQLSQGDARPEAAKCRGQGVDVVQQPPSDGEPLHTMINTSPCNDVPAAADVRATAGAAIGSANRSPGLGVGQQFPTPSPGTGVQFPSPSSQLLRLQDLLGTVPGSASHERECGVSTACQRIVSMLPSLRAPSPSVQSDPGSGLIRPTLPVVNGPQMGLAPGSSKLSGERGVSTECQRVVQMLPGLRVPTPSVQSRFASGSVPLATQACAFAEASITCDNVTPTTANGGVGQSNTQPGSSKRRSTGSPIDGICGSGQRRNGAGSAAADLSHAHGMGAPEAFTLAAAQQEQYSFVDLNPASTRKASCNGEKPQATAGVNKDLTLQPGDTSDKAALMAAAAATALPPSPANSHRKDAVAGAGASMNGCVLPYAGNPFVPGKTSPTRRTSAGPHYLADAASLSPPAREVSPDPAAAVILSGSVASNQVSCSMPGVDARAMAQRHEAQNVPTTRANAVPQAQVADGEPQDNAKTQNAMQSLLSPRTAAVKVMEHVSRWHVDVLSCKPTEAFRLTHQDCGMVFDLVETKVDDEEVTEATAKEECMAVEETFFEYTPLDLGKLSNKLPPYLQESILVPKGKWRDLLDKINQFVASAATAARTQS